MRTVVPNGTALEGRMADREAAARLKRELRVAMSAAGIDTWDRLALASKVSPTTVENWIYARTVPQAKQLRIVGEFLRPYTSPAALEAAYAGMDAPEPPLIDTLREIVPELHELILLLRAQADEAVLEAVRDALSERRPGYGGPRAAPPSEPSSETDRE
jgi:hypothetical protein